MLIRVLFVAIAMIALPAVAHADPCEGELPSRSGQVFSGTVRYVGDGDSICVGKTTDPNEWIEVRLADFDAPELREPDGRRSREVLLELAHDREVSCMATRGRSGRVVSHDRVIATCQLGGQTLGDLLRERGAPEGGN